MAKNRTNLSWVGMLSLVACLAFFGALVVLAAGGVTGEEFAPTTFRQRTYHYWRIPLLQMQITPTYYDDTTTAVGGLLRSRNLVQTGLLSNARWDLVSFSGGSTMTNGPAKIIVDYLRHGGDTSDHWTTWVDRHPQAARPFWRAVQQAAECDAYEVLPALFAWADRLPDGASWDAQVEQQFVADLLELAHDCQLANQESRADGIYVTVVRAVPDHPEARKLRAELDPALLREIDASHGTPAKSTAPNIDSSTPSTDSSNRATQPATSDSTTPAPSG